jgi:hypothetical protein
MAYPDQYTLGEDPAFQRRVQVALAEVCGSNLVAGLGDSGLRAAAQRFLDDLKSADAIAPAVRSVARSLVGQSATVAASAPTGASLTDAQLKTAVTTLLPALVR